MSVALDELVAMATFAHVVEAQSFSGAAARLGISKSVVSGRVAWLEDRLGVRLLNRTTRKISLTDVGTGFFPACARLVADAEAATDLASNLGRDLWGTLRISAPIGFAHLGLTAAFKTFLELHPRVQIELSLDDRFVDVVHGGFDVVVRVARADRAHGGSGVARRLRAEREVICASPAYLKRYGVPQTPQELVRHNCLRYSNLTAPQEWHFSGHTSIPVTGNFATGSGMMLRTAALEGMGVARLPGFLVASDLKAGALVEVLKDVPRPELVLYLVYAQRRNLPPRVRAFVEHVLAWKKSKGREGSSSQG